MNRLFYPAIFHKAEEGGFWVTYPDIPECMTQGEDMEQAYEMAVDALGLSLSAMESECRSIPKASLLDELDAGDGILVVVEFDMDEYRRKNCSRAVKKTFRETLIKAFPVPDLRHEMAYTYANPCTSTGGF